MSNGKRIAIVIGVILLIVFIISFLIFVSLPEKTIELQSIVGVEPIKHFIE